MERQKEYSNLIVPLIHELSVSTGRKAKEMALTEQIYEHVPGIIEGFKAGEISKPFLFYVGNALGVDLRIETEDGVY